MVIRLYPVGKALGVRNNDFLNTMIMAEKTRILIITNEIDLGRLMRNYYVRKGYPVGFAHNFKEGLVKAQQWQPDLILLAIETCQNMELDLDKLRAAAPPHAVIDVR